ncbi:MAG: tail fiber domain-containing protein, partial [Alphaproteobacteria bacterium]
SPLHVVGDIRTSTGLVVSGYGGFNYTSGKGLSMATGGTVPLDFTTTGQTRMTIDSGGNVGVGTSPGAKFHVSGASRFDGTTHIYNGNTLQLTDSGLDRTASMIFNNDAEFRISTSVGSVALMPASNVGVGTATPLSKFEVNGAGNFTAPLPGASGIANRVPASQGSLISWNDSGGFGETSISNHRGTGNGGIWFNLFGATGAFVSTPMMITGSGNVGVGTTTPTTKLDVAGTVNATGFTINGTPISSGSSQWTTASSNIYFNTGDVGVGTSTPGYKLDVVGTIRASQIYATSAESRFGSGSFTDPAPGVYDAKFGGNNGGIAVKGQSYFGSKVGIGTNTPAATLQIEAPFSANLVVQNTNATSNSDSNITLRNYRGSQGGGDPVITSFAARGSPSAPSPVIAGMGLLSLRGQGYAEAGFGADRTGASIDFIAHDNWGNSTVTTDMLFSTASANDWATTEKMRITFDGKVGIGVTAPSEKLEVSGNVKATSFISTSDIRLKKNVEKVSGLEFIRKLTGVKWQWKANEQTDAGVIAQDVERVMPYAVVTDK